MDHIAGREAAVEGGQPDMRHLSKPRGKGYTFRMVTPEALIGTHNPLTGRPFGREIKLGLGTRCHAEAIRLRDVHLGQVRQLEAEALRNKGRQGAGRVIDLSPENAAEWLEMRQSAKNTNAVDHVLLDELDKAARSGHEDAAQSFAAVVFRGAVRLSTTAIRISSSPRFLRLFMIDSQNLAPSLAAIQSPRTSRSPSGVTPRAT